MQFIQDNDNDAADTVANSSHYSLFKCIMNEPTPFMSSSQQQEDEQEYSRSSNITKMKPQHDYSALFSLLPCPVRNDEFRPFSFEDSMQDPSLEPRPLAPSSPSPTSFGEDARCSSSLRDFLGDASFVGSEVSIASSRPPSSISNDDGASMWQFSSMRSKRDESSPSNDATLEDFPISRKRQKTSQQETSHDYTGPRFRPHQNVLWQEQFQKLLDFKEEHGHCCVPITFSDQMLARWVKRQRYQYKKNQDGKQSVINTERIDLLESIGFIWDAHSVLWEEKWNELAAYAKAHGHCRLPAHDPNNIQLTTWAKCQRRQYKLMRSGKHSNMTDERVEKLNSLGFIWNLQQRSSPILRHAES